MGTIAYSVYADSSQGSVTVLAEKPIITDIVFPLSATPGTWLTLTFTLQYGMGLASGDELYADLYSAGVVPDLSYGGPSTTVSLFNHYRAYWANLAGSPWIISGIGYGPNGVFQNPTTTPLPPVTNGADIQFSILVKFNALADATL